MSENKYNVTVDNSAGAFCWCITLIFIFTINNKDGIDLLDALIKFFAK